MVVFVQVSQIANSVNKVILSCSVTLSLIGGIRGISLKNITYNLVIAELPNIELKTSSFQWKLLRRRRRFLKTRCSAH